MACPSSVSQQSPLSPSDTQAGLLACSAAAACTGVVPACAALDCLTVFARSVADGSTIMQVMEGADAGGADVWRRLRLALPGLPQQGFRFGVPAEQFTEWDGPGEEVPAAPCVLQLLSGPYCEAGLCAAELRQHDAGHCS